MPNLAGSGLPHPQSYDTSAPDGVVDRVTSLTWQRVLEPGVRNLHPADLYCKDLRLAGHDDWRLPAMIELASIADTSRTDPAADPVAFANTPSTPFWSAQTDITNSGLGWYVSFKTGGAYVGNDIQRFFPIRCVRGRPPCIDDSRGTYAVEEGTVRDDPTGLTWEREVEPKDYAWQDAVRLCATLSLNGGGWRLPSLRELLTLVDVARFEPAIDGLAFPNTPSALFWSSTPSLAPAGTAWGVNFTRGSSGAATVATKANIRCVR